LSTLESKTVWKFILDGARNEIDNVSPRGKRSVINGVIFVRTWWQV